MATQASTTQARVGIATCQEFPALYGDEQKIMPALAERGVAAEPVVWSDRQVDWTRFDAVLVRSIWDYFRSYDLFLGWLSLLEAKRVPLFNSSALVRWNADKHYLLDLERAGVSILPTALLEPGSTESLAPLLEARGWARAVVKPAVSGNAEHTHVVSRETAAEVDSRICPLRATAAFLVQPFAPEIQEEGEWSLLFFGQRFSHAVLKRPAAGDFRVQLTYGGTTSRVQPSAVMLRQAQAVVDALPDPPVYVRVDGVKRGDTFLLMEAEAIEPYLYLDAAPEQLGAFADAVAAAVRGPNPRGGQR